MTITDQEIEQLEALANKTKEDISCGKVGGDDDSR